MASNKQPKSYIRIAEWASNFTPDELAEIRAKKRKGDWAGIYADCGSPKSADPVGYAKARARWAGQYERDIIQTPNAVAINIMQSKYGANLRLGDSIGNTDEMENALPVDTMVDRLGRRTGTGVSRGAKIFDEVQIPSKNNQINSRTMYRIEQTVKRGKFKDAYTHVRLYVHYKDGAKNDVWLSSHEENLALAGAMIQLRINQWAKNIVPGFKYLKGSDKAKYVGDSYAKPATPYEYSLEFRRV